MASKDNQTALILPHYSLPKCGAIHPVEDHNPYLDTDHRGWLYLWEPPKRGAKYVMGVDPSVGITGWARHNRTQNDSETDNGAIEVLRIGNGRDVPDVQVAEYAAPIDAEDLADIAALLGRLYCGSSEFNEALCVIEVYPGPGPLTQRRMVAQHGYQNFYRPENLNAATRKPNNTYGWTSSFQSLQTLWAKISRHIGKALVVIKSDALLDEMADLYMKPGMSFPEPTGSHVHDDRVRALAMAVFSAHNWSLAESGYVDPKPIDSPLANINPQASDMTYLDYEDWAEERYQSLLHD